MLGAVVNKKIVVIGLAIVRAHDGKVDVESCPGAGSTFRVSLPALDPRAVPDDDREASQDLQATV